MESCHLQRNLDLLEKRDLRLASLLRTINPTGKYLTEKSRSGPMGLIQLLQDGSRKTLHSIYNPAQEATKFLEPVAIEETANFFITGMGLGYHVKEILRRAPPASRLIIIEKEPELLLLAFSHNDFTDLLIRENTSILVGIEPSELCNLTSDFKIQFAMNGFATIAFKPLIDAEIVYYHSINKTFENIIQEDRMDFKTQSAFSRSFYENIIENLPSTLASIGINDLKDKFLGVPAIIVSAGPSLDKNIHLLKQVGNKAILIAVATALRPLLSNQIEPDFVVAIDPDPSLIKAFDLKKTPQKTWLLFDPCAPPPIIDGFAGKKITFDSNIYLSQWLAQNGCAKGSLGRMQSVAHTAMKFARHLGCRPIILTGQDLAFNEYRLHCTGSYFYEHIQDSLQWLHTMNYMQKQNYMSYMKSMVTAKDIFGNPAKTTAAMNAYNHLFAQDILESDDVVNATEGGIPILNVNNVCLREAIYIRCKDSVESIKQKTINGFQPERQGEQLVSALHSQANKLRQLQHKLEDLNTREDIIKNRSLFVAEMENIYRELLQDTSSIQLLQGYAYKSFMEWNKSNNEITLKAHEPEKLLLMKYERDRKFIEALIEASTFLCNSFNKMAQQATQLTPQEK